MYPRTNYEMTQEDLCALLDACKPVPYMIVGGIEPRSAEQNANDAWRALGEKMGFCWDTAEPVPGKGARFFTAIPSETEEAQKERKEREELEARRANIARLEKEVEDAKRRLSEALS